MKFCHKDREFSLGWKQVCFGTVYFYQLTDAEAVGIRKIRVTQYNLNPSTAVSKNHDRTHVAKNKASVRGIVLGPDNVTHNPKQAPLNICHIVQDCG